jgi:hypothetical protein
VVAAVRDDAVLNDPTCANADSTPTPAFAFLLADAEFHVAVVRVLRVAAC